ncbi:hypothetical protein Hdeb2414_s0007g00238201 [Helianthus debilis subsp. tardiflorus]
MKMAGAVRTGGKGSMRRYGCNNNRIITVCLSVLLKLRGCLPVWPSFYFLAYAYILRQEIKYK